MAPRERRPRSGTGRNGSGDAPGLDERSLAKSAGAEVGSADDSDEPEGPGRQRIDKWLWHARFFKTRSLAARVCREGRVRRNGAVVTKPSALVEPQDVLTFIQGERVRVVRILALAERRGPASEAQALYEDLTGD